MTTTSTAKNSRSVKSNKLEVPKANVQLISSIVKRVLNGGLFTRLRDIPNIHYVVRAVFTMEVNDLQLTRRIGGRQTSRHYTSAETSKIVTVDYKGSRNYRAFNKRQDITPEQRYNLEDGYYAHGISAVMGGYFIRGTESNSQIRAYRPVIDYYAGKGIPLEVNLGESLTTLYTTSNLENNLEASIVQGLIILTDKVRAASEKIPDDPFKALMLAVGYYVGKGKDANGYTGLDRIIDVSNRENTKLNILAVNGVKPIDEEYFKKLDTRSLAVAFKGKPTKSSGQTFARVTPARVATTSTITPTKTNC